MDGLTKRNFLALSEGLKEQRAKNSDQDTKIRLLEEQLAQARQDLQILTNRFNVLFAQMKGTGATS